MLGLFSISRRAWKVAFIFGIASYLVLVTLHVHKLIAFVVALFLSFFGTYWFPKHLEKMPKLAEKIADIKEKIRYYLRFRGR